MLYTYLNVWRSSWVEDVFSNSLNDLILLKSRVIFPDTAIPETPISIISVTSFIIMPPKPIIGIGVFNTSVIAV